MIEQLLGRDLNALASSMATRLGLPADQAESFVSKALASVESGFMNGRIDLDSLLKGDFSSLLGPMDLGALSQFFGGDTAKARSGVVALLESLSSQVASSGIDVQRLLSQFMQTNLGQAGADGGGAGGKGGAGDLGGIGDTLGSLASRLLGGR